MSKEGPADPTADEILMIYIVMLILQILITEILLMKAAGKLILIVQAGTSFGNIQNAHARGQSLVED